MGMRVHEAGKHDRAGGVDATCRGVALLDRRAASDRDDATVGNRQGAIVDRRIAGSTGDDRPAGDEQVDLSPLAHADAALSALPISPGRTSWAKRSNCSRTWSRTIPGKCGNRLRY